MANLPNSQDIPKSTTMWSQPSTDAQRKYYSKHAPKRRVYGVIMTVLQGTHGALAFSAWSAVFVWALGKFAGDVPMLITTLALGSLLAFHILFRVTWETFWYDRLDDDPNTDSSIFIPLVLFLLLLFIEQRGTALFLQGQIESPVAVDTHPIESEHSTTLASIEQGYNNEKSEIIATFKARESAATIKYDRAIAAERRRLNSAETPADRRAINGRIASLNAQRDNALAPILAQKADALQRALDNYTSRRNAETARRDQSVAGITSTNQAEMMRYQTEMSSVHGYAWILSLSLLLLISALGYARVRINVKSGIIPLRNYTVLDAHGSTIERIGTAFGDAFNRRSQQFAVWLHRTLSPNDPITSFDGTVVARPGTYNTPDGFLQPNPDPHPPVTDQEAILKVLEKAKRHGIVLDSQNFLLEMQKAKAMNGSYADAPFPPGK